MAVWKIIILVYIFMLSVEAKFLHHTYNDEDEGVRVSSICDPAFNSTALVQCFCVKDSIDVVRTAECYPTHENISHSDPSWSLFNYLVNASKLSLTNTRGISLKYIPTNALQRAENLLKLDVKYGNIKAIESFAFANLSKTEEITLSGNQIEKLKVHAFAHHKMLKTISLDSNNIIEINRDVFVDLPSLETLFMTNNKITIIHDRAFIHLTNLKELEIDRNKLFSLNSETFSGLMKLLKLDLCNNNLEVIGDNTFKPLSRLESLNLDDNKIQMLDSKAFHGLSNLKSLSLAHNELTAIDNLNILKGLQSLISLNLKDNKIRDLDQAVMDPILPNLYQNTGSLDVEDNNFPCDCRLEWFMLLMNRTQSASLKLLLENLKCMPNEMLRDRWMKRVETEKASRQVPEGDEPQTQSDDYEYYDETELNGKLFYTDIRGLLNCTLTRRTTTVKPERKTSTKITPNPIFITTTEKFGHKEQENGYFDESIFNMTTASRTAITDKNEVANQEIKKNIPNIYTTNRLATVSAKPLEQNSFGKDDMASDEAKPDSIKAHRSIQQKNDDYNDLFSSKAQSFYRGSFKTALFVIAINIRFLFY